jgi:hypothetical protein
MRVAPVLPSSVMQSHFFSNVYHLEDNVYCNDDVVVCRFFKLVIVYYKTQNVFSFYLLKRSKESSVSTAIMSLLNAENPESTLRMLIGTDPPSPLSCQVEECEIKLIPQCLGNFDVLVSFETQQSLMATENKACIVHVNDDQVVELFRLLTSPASPNPYAKTELVTRLKNVYEDLPSQTILLASPKSLSKSMCHIPDDKHDVTIHLVHEDRYFRPQYPGMNFTVVYLDEDRKVAEALLPEVNSIPPHYNVKKLASLRDYF